MKACVLEAIGQLRYKEFPAPIPCSGEVLLKIKRCGICSSDIDRVFKTGTYHFPTIPGHEFSGEIVALGPDVEASYLRRRAAVFPLLPCFHCPSCAVEEYARCDNYNYFGSRCNGGFAEYLAVPVWNLALFSESLSYDTAALCEPAAVALHAVNVGAVHEGSTVVVLGSGTIGLLAAMCARLYGADKVIVVGRSLGKLRMANSLGFENTISTLEGDPAEQITILTEGQGADIVLEMAGTSETTSKAINYAKKGGTVVLTGNPVGDMTFERGIYWKILRKELTLRGTWNSRYRAQKDEWAKVLQYMEQGKLPAEKLITHQFSLRDCEEAFRTARDCRDTVIKVMFRISD